MVGAINLHCMSLEMGGDRMAVSESPLSGLICKTGELFSWSRKCYISQEKKTGNFKLLTELKISKGFQNPNTLFQNHTSAMLQY